MQNIEQLRKDVVDAKKELSKAKEEKEKVLLEVNHLSDEKIGYIKEIGSLKEDKVRYCQLKSKAQEEFEAVNRKIDQSQNKLAELESNAKHVTENADKLSKEASDFMGAAKKSWDESEQKRLSIKREQAILDENIRKQNALRFDYVSALENLNVDKVRLDKKYVEADEAQRIAIQFKEKMEISIKASNDAEKAANEVRKDLELQRSNYIDRKNQLNEENVKNENKAKELESQKAKNESEFQRARLNVESTKRSLNDLKNRENELRIKELRFQKLVKDKGMEQELKEYEEYLK